MIDNEQTHEEQLQVIRDYVVGMLSKTNISEEAKAHAAEQCPEFLRRVVWKSLVHDKIEDIPQHLRTAILGYVGGYAARHLYALKKKMEFEKGNE